MNRHFCIAFALTIFVCVAAEAQVPARRAANDESELVTRVYRVTDLVLETRNYAFSGIDLPGLGTNDRIGFTGAMGGGGMMGGGMGGFGGGGMGGEAWAARVAACFLSMTKSAWPKPMNLEVVAAKVEVAACELKARGCG